jgi:hypothetical protein
VARYLEIPEEALRGYVASLAEERRREEERRNATPVVAGIPALLTLTQAEMAGPGCRQGWVVPSRRAGLGEVPRLGPDENVPASVQPQPRILPVTNLPALTASQRAGRLASIASA